MSENNSKIIKELKEQISKFKIQEVEYKNTIKRLKPADDRLKYIIDSSGIGIIDYLVPISYHLYYCDTFASILGYENDKNFLFYQELDWFREQIDPEDFKLIKPDIDKLINNEVDKINLNFRIKHKNGEWIYVSFYCVVVERNNKNEINRIIGVLQNISAQMNKDRALIESESRYHGIFENSPLSLWEEDWSDVKIYLDKLRDNGVTDFSKYFAEHHQAISKCVSLVKILDVNKETLYLHKANNKEQVISNLQNVFTDASMQKFGEEIVSFAEGNLYFQAENIHRTLDGQILHIRLQMNVVPGHEENLSKIIVSMIDITEKKKVEKEREIALDDLNKLKQSHEDLENIISVCFSCHKIRIDDKFNKGIINYLQTHPDAEFTHYVCPECKTKIIKQNSNK